MLLQVVEVSHVQARAPHPNKHTPDVGLTQAKSTQNKLFSLFFLRLHFFWILELHLGCVKKYNFNAKKSIKHSRVYCWCY